MARYIDADKISYFFGARNQILARKEVIDEVPTADVQEVIYCKNCKNYYKYENGAVVCEEFGGYIKDTDFCSRGTEKKMWCKNGF